MGAIKRMVTGGGGGGIATSVKLGAGLGGADAPPPPVDEADAVDTGKLMAQRASAGLAGFRRAFLSGPRGPGGPAWQAPEVTTSPISQTVVDAVGTRAAQPISRIVPKTTEPVTTAPPPAPPSTRSGGKGGAALPVTAASTRRRGGKGRL